MEEPNYETEEQTETINLNSSMASSRPVTNRKDKDFSAVHNFILPEQRITNGKYEQLLVTKEIRRNDPCSCGSGKKAKNCCGSGKEHSIINHSNYM